MSNFEQECLDEHNRLRARHGCPPLVLDSNLCTFAKQWAMHLASRGMMQHRQNNKYGENIYMSMGMKVNGAIATKNWYSEDRFYTYGSNNYNSRAGHFSQVIWKSSKKLGVGLATRGNTTYVVANYDPAGNMQGSFASNVPPPCK